MGMWETDADRGGTRLTTPDDVVRIATLRTIAIDFPDKRAQGWRGRESRCHLAPAMISGYPDWP